MTLTLDSPARTRKIERPPMPSSGLSTASPCSPTKALSAAASRLTRVGGAALGELERGELLVEVAQALRVVHHLRALALHEPQQQGVVDESGIDRRIPAHQHHVTGSRRAT